jgi:glycosyltransferase involved in cell wall biosynthesis
MQVMRELRRRAAVLASTLFRMLPGDFRQWLAPGLRRLYHRQVAASMPQAAPLGSIGRGLPWGVGVFGYLKAESGVGEGARSSVLSLEAASVPAAAIDVRMGVYANRETGVANTGGRDNPFAVNLAHINADQMARLPELIGAVNHARRYTIAYWAWELAVFPDALLPAFEPVHEVWVPSRFVAHALLAKTDKPVRVMPHRVEARAPTGASRAQFGLPDNGLLFLAVVDFNSFLERKNVAGAIEAFRRAFPEGTTAAHLVIKAHGGAKSLQVPRAKLLELIGSDPRITVIEGVLPRAEVTALQAVCDVFVSLHRAEGFGLPIAECMALGKTVIATDYSGSTDFVTADCALPVPYRLTEVTDKAYPLGAGQVWADADLDEASRLMRLAADHPDLRARLGAAAARKMAAEFGAAVIGARMAARLAEIRGQLGAS